MTLSLPDLRAQDYQDYRLPDLGSDQLAELPPMPQSVDIEPAPITPEPAPDLDNSKDSTVAPDKVSDVTGIRPFSPEANYMSLPGKLRYDTYANTGVWMTREEAVAAVNQQINAAGR
jgi:hypothetical protein